MTVQTVDIPTLMARLRAKRLLAVPADTPDTAPLEGSSNRGNKLKRGGGELDPSRVEGVHNDTMEVEYSGRKRRVIVPPVPRPAPLGLAIDSGSEDDDDVYRSVKLDQLLAPVLHPADVVLHPALSQTFQSTTARALAQQTIEVIEKEQETVVQLLRLMTVFLGDDPSTLLANNLDLPEYNHHLTLNVVKDETEDSEDRRVTRNLGLLEEDPFFALPRLVRDPTLGLDAELVENTRHHVQIALQRLDEYIRCLSQVRTGLVRTDRLKDQLFKWCREMNGDYE